MQNILQFGEGSEEIGWELVVVVGGGGVAGIPGGLRDGRTCLPHMSACAYVCMYGQSFRRG